MIDARNTFRKVSKNINDFSPDQLDGLTSIIEYFRGKKIDFKKNKWLIKTFKNGKYVDIDGLCKITSINNIVEKDYSLNPGKYVGFSIKIDENFDYQTRLSKINDELKKLNTESKELMKIIQSIKP